jgi:hypothetical protein
MAMKLAAGALARDARMVLRLLSKPGARLAETGSGQWVIESNGRCRRGQTIEAAIVRELAGRDWLIKEPSGSYRISVAGERWLAGAWKAGQDASPAERFADQHRLVQRPEPGARGGLPRPVFNEAESPLGWLRNRRDKSGAPLISEAQYDAGERLRVDFTIAQLSARVTVSWNSPVAPGSHGRSGRRPDSLEVNERALTAKRRFMRALDAVGPELSGILMEVCCLSRGLEAAERSLGWPQRSGKLVLQIALTQLARHYGLIRDQTEPHRPASIRHWGVEDYRPQVGLVPGDEDQA